MTTFLAIQNTYDLLEIAIMQKQKMVAHQQIDKKYASKLFIPKLTEVLKDATIKLKEIEFIAVNQGPGPFTTLRTVIASVNGLSFATRIPLIGVDGLHAFLHEYHEPTGGLTVALLNAFTFDIYYGVQENNQIIETGYAPIKEYLTSLKATYPDKKFYFIGNGVSLYIKNIEEIIGDRAVIPSPLPEYCSLQEVANFGLKEWENHNVSKQLLPIYLKQHPAMQK